MKKVYTQPETEVLSQLPGTSILDGSIDGTLESYGDQNDFTW